MPRPPHTIRRRGWAKTLTITSALLAVVWVGSMRWGGSVKWPSRYLIGGDGGAFLLVRYDVPWISGVQGLEGQFEVNWRVRWWPYRERIEGLGSRFSDFTIWLVPLWPFILLTGVPGVWMLAKSRHPKGAIAGANLCPSCHYDLTGLPQTPSGPSPCPECGSIAQS